MGIVNDGRGNICPICGKPNTEINSCGQGSWFRCYTCDDCGEFFAHTYWYDGTKTDPEDVIFKEKLRQYLFYHSSNLRPFICTEDKYNRLDKSNFVEIYNLSPSMVEAWYPKSFVEKIDMILIKLDELAEYDGAYIQTSDFIEKLFFCSNKPSAGVKDEYNTNVQIYYIEEFLDNNGYVKNFGSCTYQLTPKALERIYELRRNQSNNKNVFVSMAFNDGTKQTREAIRTAIIESGYSPEFIDEIIHNKQIVPEMFRLIRECKFLILDISDPNYGAYYEAGYALGLGKEVIICCNNEVFCKEYTTKEEKKYAKYLRPHFDIAQKQLLIWSDYDDLTKKLTEWIKAIVG